MTAGSRFITDAVVTRHTTLFYVLERSTFDDDVGVGIAMTAGNPVGESGNIRVPISIIESTGDTSIIESMGDISVIDSAEENLGYRFCRGISTRQGDSRVPD